VSVKTETEAAPSTQPANAAALFEKLKALSGRYEGKTGSTDVALDYSLSGGGSAVMENCSMHGMMTTVYTLDGDRVLMTHYCAAGNQPRMACKGLEGNVAKFEFLDASGMASKDDPHMHGLTITFGTDGALQQDWTMYSGGKEAGAVHFDLKAAR
jgi:hypothetical protein